MKKLLLSLSFCGLFGAITAQNFDMEAWTTMNNGTISVPTEPTGWITENQLVSIISPGNTASVFQATGAEAHGGTYAMKIVTVDVVNDPSGGLLPDPAGIAMLGKVQLSPLKLIDGFPYTGKPATCSFWHMYAPVGTDTASAGLSLTKWNGTSRDTLAIGGATISAAASAYTQINFNLTYDPLYSSLIPDTLHLGFSATCIATQTCGVVGSTLWIDDITLTGTIGVNEWAGSEGVSLYPVPASDILHVSIEGTEAHSISVFDPAGKQVIAPIELTRESNQTKGSVFVGDLATGLYSYMVKNKEGEIIRSGKFNTTR